MRKVWQHIQGRDIPAVVPEQTPVFVQKPLPNGRTIPAFMVESISLRETNPNGPNPGQVYLTRTPEDLRFLNLRDNVVNGLDVDPETGALLTEQDLEERRGKDIARRQQLRVDAQAASVITLGSTSVPLDDPSELEGI